MVRYSIIIFFCFYTSLSQANTNINFQEATLTEFIMTFTKGVYKRDYVITPELYKTDVKVTLSLQNKSFQQLDVIFKELLNQYDIESKDLNGILYCSKRPNLLQHDSLHEDVTTLRENDFTVNEIPLNLNYDPVIYTPLHRQPSELSEILTLFNIDAKTKNSEFLLFTIDDERKQKVLDLLASIDVPQSQYEVVSATYEVTKNDDTKRSIDIIGQVLKNLSLSIVTSGASNVIKYTGGSLLTAFKFFDTDTRFRSISKPYARVKSGGKLHFSSGQDVPTLGNVTINNNTTTQSVEYRNSGVILDVDLMAMQNAIDIKINHELSNFTPTQTGVNNSPTLNKRNLQTELSIQDGEILVIGGLMDIQTSTSNSSFLGIAPVEQIKTNRDTETFIFLQVNKI